MNAILEPIRPETPRKAGPVVPPFPLRDADERGYSETVTAADSLKILARRILLADDDPGVREMLGRVLESEHYEVIYAATGRSAAARFHSQAPDLVLLDLNMPDSDGWEAFDIMCERNPMVPVIVITARPGQYAQAVELGVDALMEKPLNLPCLLETIRCLLAETESQRTRRLTNPGFKTRLLGPQGSSAAGRSTP
jgi:CheY-like chemotaxis protein